MFVYIEISPELMLVAATTIYISPKILKQLRLWHLEYIKLSKHKKS